MDRKPITFRPAEPLEGVEDDCLRLCVASIMGMHPRRVPNFVERYPGGTWVRELDYWLIDRGYYLDSFGLWRLSDACVPKGYWIAIVDARTACHAIVMRGRTKVYDPDQQNRFKRRVYDSGYRIVPFDEGS